MTDSTTDPAANAPTAPEEWKPEPRTWAWKDLFTAPMLAFKPKCMLISAVTLMVVGIFWNLWSSMLGSMGYFYVLTPVLNVVGIIIAAVIFSLGATLVSIFMKADLLDDEFLSLREAIGQFRKRMLPAIMVPSFLIATVFGFVVLIYLGLLLCSIPIVGSILYMVIYPLAFLLGLLTLLLFIAVVLSTFLFPSIISVRKHGWFDNVIDTFEAVGTKPHVVALNIVLTFLIASVCVGIGFGGMRVLDYVNGAREIPSAVVSKTSERASAITNAVVRTAFTGEATSVAQKPSNYQHLSGTLPPEILAELEAAEEKETSSNAFYNWFTGLFLSFWMIPITIAIIGYGLNVMLAGGMLTYLFVREDDYWDDEDLEDLDKLAKELEEEAKAEAAKAEQEVAAPAPTPAAPEVSEAGSAEPEPEPEPEPAPGPETPAPEAESSPAEPEKPAEDGDTSSEDNKPQA